MPARWETAACISMHTFTVLEDNGRQAGVQGSKYVHVSGERKPESRTMLFCNVNLIKGTFLMIQTGDISVES
jgi:hypothetical protein